MSIAYQSWEMGSTVGYKMHHTNSDGLNFTSRDAIPRGITALIYRQQQSQQHFQQHFPQHQQQQQDNNNVVKLNMNNTNGCQRLPVTVPSSTWEESSNGTTRSTLSEEPPAAQPEEVYTPVQVLNKNVPCSSSSSSIGDDTSDESDDKEVQSCYKGPLEQMDTLTTTLPIRRGLSKFYNGRSRSFASLAEVKSVKDLVKPENPYSKRRKLPSHREGRFPPPRISTAAGIAKKAATNGTTLTLAVAMSSLESENNNTNRWQKCNRSFSLTDLQKA